MKAHSFWQEILRPEVLVDYGYPARFDDGRILVLPIRPLPDGRHALASLIISQASFEVSDAIAAELALKLKRFEVDVIVGLPTLGLTLASAVARCLGHSRYVPLSTSAKFWYRKELSTPLSSITSPGQPKQLHMDPRMLPLLEGRRVALIDDVISTGSSMEAGINLLRLCDIKPVVLGTAMLQSDRWEGRLEGWPIAAVLHSPLIDLATKADNDIPGAPMSHDPAPDSFRLLIEQGDVAGLREALERDRGLANRTIRWHLNQDNESDPLHFVSDCVSHGWLTNGAEGEIAALLLKSGAELNGSVGRESPLIAAASLGAEKVAKILIDAGAELERTSVFGSRALHWAAWTGQSATVGLLIARGAQIEVKDDEFSSTPLFWAVHGYGRDGAKEESDQVGAARLLIQAGATVQTTNKQGLSALELADSYVRREMYELLSSPHSLIGR